MWWSWSSLPALVLLSELTVVRVQTAPCQTCRKLTESFITVLELHLLYVNLCFFPLNPCLTFPPFVSLCFRAWRKQPIRTLGEVTLRGKKKSWPSMHAGKKTFHFKSQPHLSRSVWVSWLIIGLINRVWADTTWYYKFKYWQMTWMACSVQLKSTIGTVSQF